MDSETIIEKLESDFSNWILKPIAKLWKPDSVSKCILSNSRHDLDTCLRNYVLCIPTSLLRPGISLISAVGACIFFGRNRSSQFLKPSSSFWILLSEPRFKRNGFKSIGQASETGIHSFRNRGTISEISETVFAGFWQTPGRWGPCSLIDHIEGLCPPRPWTEKLAQ